MNSQTPAVLYVDDERPNRIVFEQSFNKVFFITTVGSGAEALELLKGGTIGVLVTDQKMPDMSGNELLTRAKALYPDVIRIVITAYSDLDPILSAVNEGLVARYLIKPWDRTELESILTWAVEAYSIGQKSSAIQLRLLATERLVTLGSIAAAVIHDFAQPLAYLVNNSTYLVEASAAAGALDRLLRRHGSELTPEERDLLTDLAVELPRMSRDMVDGCAIITGLINSLRRLSGSKAEEEQAVTDPIPIIRYALSVCREIGLHAQAKLLYDGPTSIPKVRIGPTELTQVLINLVTNAAQALLAKGGGGGHAIVSASDTGHSVRFVVSDSGTGMSPEVLQKVGKPFFSTRPLGIGLGMSQCHRLIEKGGGTVEIESTEGVGTTVSFTVPKA